MMSVNIVTAEQMRWADQATIEAGTSSFDLMDRAGMAVAGAVLDQMPDFGRMVVVAGPGNNGGDGFAAARYLRKRRLPVTVVLLVPYDSLTGDTLRHAELAVEAGVKIREADHEGCFDELNRWLMRALMVIDALFGTGLNRPLEGRMAEAITQMNDCGRPVLSIDIASGLHADSGAVMGTAVRASMTLPVAACKWGYWMGDGPDYSGQLLPVASIGISETTITGAWSAVPELCVSAADMKTCLTSARFIDDDLIAAGWPKRQRISHKGKFGRVWVFGGSTGYTGAPRLTALGAMAAGAGLVSIVCPDEVYPIVAAGSLEAMVHPQSSGAWMREDDGLIEQADAIVAGPGWGSGQGTLLASLMLLDCPLLLDADALNSVAADEGLQHMLARRTSLTVLTPHPGEAARLLGCSVDEIQADRKKAVLSLTNRFACRVVLKGNETLLASEAGEVMLNPFGSAQLAVGGSGDVLAGMLGRQMAVSRRQSQSVDALLAAAVGLHGWAGEQPGWYLAGELASVIAGLRQDMERQAG